MRSLLFLGLLMWSASALALDCSSASLQRELQQRREKDQLARQALIASPQSKTALNRALRTDAENTAYMRALIAKCGWPKQSVVGEAAAMAAWLLTQHADMDPQFQVLAAQQMKYAAIAKEASALHFALLVDRNRLLTNQPQVYGMQFHSGTDKVIHFHDIIAPSQLDARRAEVGLIPFYCLALQVSRENDRAAIEWPDGVLFAPVDCDPEH